MNKPVVIGAVLLLALAAWKLSNHEPDKRGSGPASPGVGSEASMSSDSPAASSVNPGSASQAFRPGSAFEAGLLAGLKAREFGPTVDELATHDPNPRNPLANEYLNLLETTLAVFNPRARVDRFACGATVCLAAIQGKERGRWFEDWYGNIQGATSLPMGALTRFDALLPDGNLEHRILFTTQPHSADFLKQPSQVR